MNTNIRKALSILNAVGIAIFLMAILLCGLYGIVKVHPAVGMPVGMLFTGIACILEDRETHGWSTALGIAGFLLYFSFFFAIGLFWNTRVIEEDNKVIIVRGINEIWGEKLEEGICADHLHLAHCYSRYYGTCSVDSCCGILLHKEGGLFVLYNNWSKVCEGYRPQFEKRDYGHGNLDIISFIDKETGQRKFVDMRGTNINDENYQPFELDRTPDFNTNNP